MEKIYHVHGTGYYNINVKVRANSEEEAFGKAEEEYFDGIVEIDVPVGECEFHDAKELDNPAATGE